MGIRGDRVNSFGFYVAEVCRLYVFLLLAAAVVGKARQIAVFEMAVAELLQIGPSAGRVTVYAVLAAEAVTALLLLAGGSWAYWGSIAAIVLFCLFTAVLATALAQGRAIACNCFGGSEHVISAYDLVRNAILIAACGYYLAQAPIANEVCLAIWLVLTGVALIAVIISSNLDAIAVLAR